MQAFTPDKITPRIAELLESEAARINSTAFISEDPVQFPRKFERLQDIEISALIAGIMAWGNRKMICRDIDKTLTMMDWQPYEFIKEAEYELISDQTNLHRTLFGSHLKHLFRGLRFIYSRFGSLDAFSQSLDYTDGTPPSFTLTAKIQEICTAANDGNACSRCLPLNFDNTALKRFNMILRWLVRDDGIVDLGVWKSIPKAKLLIPMDIHVGNTARELGLLYRKANDRKSTEALTRLLATLRPADPVYFDYALFGLGIEGKLSTQNH